MDAKMDFTSFYKLITDLFPKISLKVDSLHKNEIIITVKYGIEVLFNIEYNTYDIIGKKLYKNEISKIISNEVEKSTKLIDSSANAICVDSDSENSKNTPDSEIIDLNKKYENSEIVIGLVYAVGTPAKKITEKITNRLKAYKYTNNIVKVSDQVIKNIFSDVDFPYDNNYQRIKSYIIHGNEARKTSGDNSILALGSVAKINELRMDKNKKNAFIIDSFKHPSEAEKLRKIYGKGYYQISIYCDERTRLKSLTDNCAMTDSQADELIKIDIDEIPKNGQHTRDTFQTSDFFINCGDSDTKLQNSIQRIFDLIFGNPFLTPEFDEYAMFNAFTASLRSADLSRQVGAAISNQYNEIVATGTNDVPKFDGGLYWPIRIGKTGEIEDVDNGRDYKRGYDSNKKQINDIVDDIKNKLVSNEILNECVKKNNIELEEIITDSKIKDITEYGRIVHAEMESLMMCARNNISSKGATLYCTTFPCHNCAKHIVAAGIKSVIYIEPYPKSKANEFYTDSILVQEISEDDSDLSNTNKVVFKPFVGVGPNRFFELFSMNLGVEKIKRKDKTGKKIEWEEPTSMVKYPLLPYSYLDCERTAIKNYQELVELVKTK